MEEPLSSSARDADLVAGFLGGDSAGFEALLEKYGKAVFNFIRRFLGDPEASRDVFQETLVSALKDIERFDTSRRFLPWILGIAVNRCREEKRRRKHPPIPPDDGLGGPASHAAGPDAAAAEKETVARIASAVAALDDAHRAVFLLKVYGDFTYAQVGEILTISEGTAKSRMHYAVYAVRKALHETKD